MLKERANTLCVLQILKEYSDENHIVPMRQLIGKIEERYQSKIDRRTIYASIALLNEMGYDISTYEENGKGYYLRSRELEHAEICLLIDSLFSFAAASPKQIKYLVRKLQNQLSSYQRRSYRNIALLSKGKMSNSEEVFDRIDFLDDAITKSKKISFFYLSYTFDKSLKPGREERYVVSPYGMICAHEHYYLICMQEENQELSHFRIDRISDLKCLRQSVSAPPSTMELFKYSKETVCMYGGSAESVVIRCDDCALEAVLDQFGLDTLIMRDKEKKTFDAVLKAAPEWVRGWALGHLQHIEVVSPLWLRNEIISMLDKNPYRRK